MNQQLSDFEIVYGENVSEHLLPAQNPPSTNTPNTIVPNHLTNPALSKNDQSKIKQLETRINTLNHKLDMYKKRIVEQEARIMSLETTLKMLGMN